MGTLDKVKGLVENPPKEYRSAPFWGWNDNTEDPLEAMRAYGLPKYPKDVVFPDWKLLEEEEEIESWR